MDRIDAITVPRTLPRPAAAGDIAAALGVICSRRPRKDVPLDVLRGQVLFETAYVCGARASEVCGTHVEDLDLRLDEHARVHGKSGTIRTVLLDERGYVVLLRLYLARSGYMSGPLFRASINGAAARCPMTLHTPGGRSTVPRPASRSASTSSVTLMPQSRSTAASPSRWFAAALATPPPRPPRSTLCSPTRSPTPRFVPPAIDARPLTGSPCAAPGSLGPM